MNLQNPTRPIIRITAIALLLATAACASLGASGPSAGKVNKLANTDYAGQGITLVDLNKAALQQIGSYEKSRSLSAIIGDAPAVGAVIGVGDMLDITIWEAPPAVLFGAGGSGAGSSSALGAQTRSILQQMVSGNGTLNVPFAGRLDVAGRATGEVESEIRRRLAGRANDPQVTVRLVQNDARNVTVIGEVASSRRVPLGPRGERLLDVLASAGGSRHPLAQTSVQVTRNGTSAIMALDAIIGDPQQNIRMRPDDIVSVAHQPFTFVALGAVARNAEVPFEGRGISLAQALGRIGGLRDDRASLRGVFIFRLEDPAAMAPSVAAIAPQTKEGRVPVVYRLNLSDASAFFVAQDFAIRDKDVIYVSTAPAVELQRFISTLSGFAFSAIALTNAVTTNP